VGGGFSFEKQKLVLLQKTQKAARKNLNNLKTLHLSILKNSENQKNSLGNKLKNGGVHCVDFAFNYRSD